MGLTANPVIRKVVIIGLTGIGNLFLFSPALRQLKKTLNDSQVTLLTHSQNGDLRLFASNNLVDEIIYFDNSSSLNIFVRIINLARLAWSLRKRKYDLSLIPFSGGVGFEQRVLSFLIGAKKRFLHIKKMSRILGLLNTDLTPKIEHDVDQNMDMLDQIGIHDKTVEYKLDVEKEDQDWADSQLTGDGCQGLRIGIQPGVKRSYDSTRQWPTEKFLKLCDSLSEKYVSCFYLFGKTEEREMIENVVSMTRAHTKMVIGLPLHKVSALIQRMDCFVANDSGLMHLAAAVGVPTVGIFGPTNPVRTAPYGDRHAVVRSGEPIARRYLLPGQRNEDLDCQGATLNELPPEVVLESLEKLIPDELENHRRRAEVSAERRI